MRGCYRAEQSTIAGPGALARPSAPGPATVSTEIQGPVLRVGPNAETRSQCLKGHQEEDRNRMRMLSTA
jgi:hypothetical protein